MNYIIEKSNGIPAYIQLYNFLRRDILSGAYPKGSKLPSKRIIADETGVSVITVEHAFELLCEEGYTEARQRSGVFVIYKPADFQGVAANAVPKAIDIPHITSHSTGDFPFSVMSKTMHRVLLNYSDSILVKSPNRGLSELRAEIAAYLARSKGININPNQVIIGSGAEYLYSLIAQLFSDYKKVALENPSYDKIHKVYESLGHTCDYLSMGKNGIILSDLKATDAKLLHVTPFNSFPSGISADISKKHEYLEWAKQRGGFIIEDNYDSELTVLGKPEEPLFTMTKDSNVIYLNTFSKTIAPSMRVGYMILPESLLEAFNEKLGFYSCTVPVFEQYVLAELLRTGDFERNINRIRRKKRKALL
ncbi:MAG: PLP-dependent aminotransferase family protein [Clostridia bacterium]|nr:PLP-dependent aminotransferase family protein [Clostridia bacterium]